MNGKRPTGYNDNNLYRKNLQSNIQGSKINNYSYLSEAYKPNETILDLRENKNKGNFIHNNLGNNLLSHDIIEYDLHVDSYYRNINLYYNPFSFIFNLGSINQTNNSTNTNKQYNYPCLDMSFFNVQYISLTSIILPRYTSVIEDIPGSTNYILDTNSDLLLDRCIKLNINELNSEIKSSVNDTTTPFSIITLKKTLNNNFYLGKIYGGTKYYKNSSLIKLDKLTFNFTDSYGKQLTLNNIYNINELSGKNENDIRHPLNKLFQIYFTFKIGIKNPSLNTLTNNFVKS